MLTLNDLEAKYNVTGIPLLSEVVPLVRYMSPEKIINGYELAANLRRINDGLTDLKEAQEKILALRIISDKPLKSFRPTKE